MKRICHGWTACLGRMCAIGWMFALTGCGGGGGGASPPPPPPPPTTGTIRFEIATTGAAPDADGYALALDAGAAATVTANSVSTLTNVSAGTHRVLLSNLDCNCATNAANPASVDVTAGGTTTVHVDVDCPAASAQPAVVDLYSGSPGTVGAFPIAQYGSQFVVLGGKSTSGTRGTAASLDLLNFDSTRPIATQSASIVADEFAAGSGFLQVESPARIQLVDSYDQQCQGCNLHIGLRYYAFDNPFTTTSATTTSVLVPPAGSTDSAYPFAISGSLLLYQKFLTADRSTYASRFSAADGSQQTIVPLSTSRLLTSMSLAYSGSTYLATRLDSRERVSATIETQPLTTDGLPTGTSITLENDGPTALSPAPASIAWCHDRYAAVWWAQSSYVNGHVFVQLRGRTLAADGTPLAGSVNLTPELDFSSQTGVRRVELQCLDDSGFVIAYADEIPTIQLVTTDLALATTSTREIALAGGLAQASRPQLVFDTRQFGVTWNNADSSAFKMARVCRNP